MTIKAELAFILVAATACSGGRPAAATATVDGGEATAAAARGRVTLSVVGTSDLHGKVLPSGGKGGVALLAGYLANLRAVRARDGGAVILVDAGDMWQGTLESNLGEGAVVVEAYNALGYDAAAVGNHEFDFGPVGEAATPREPGDDPFGALRARAAEARFPFLAANLIDAATGRRPDWPNVKASVMIERAGVKIGIIGATTEYTLRSTISGNVRGLRLQPVAERLAEEAQALRAAGAVVVVAAVHAGAKCKGFDRPREPEASCEMDEEIVRVAQALPPGAVDVIVAGHTHDAMAHVVNGVAVVQSYWGGRAFGRVDVIVDRGARRVLETRIERPRDVVAGEYEGTKVVADATVEAGFVDDVERARARREQTVGVVFAGALEKRYEVESAVGNLFADLMRAARPADVAFMNGGGLRADLPPGELSYGELHEAFPFDNRFAKVRLRGRDLEEVIANNLRGKGGILSVSGVRVEARCADGGLEVTVRRDGGRVIGDDEELVVVMSDFLASGGDATLTSLKLADDAVVLEDEPPVRDAVAAELAELGAGGRPLAASRWFDPRRPRMVYPGSRPVVCPR